MAHYAGGNVHKRLITEPAYSKGEYPEALKRAFLDTDEDMRSSMSWSKLIVHGSV